MNRSVLDPNSDRPPTITTTFRVVKEFIETTASEADIRAAWAHRQKRLERTAAEHTMQFRGCADYGCEPVSMKEMDAARRVSMEPSVEPWLYHLSFKVCQSDIDALDAAGVA